MTSDNERPLQHIFNLINEVNDLILSNINQNYREKYAENKIIEKLILPTFDIKNLMKNPTTTLKNKIIKYIDSNINSIKEIKDKDNIIGNAVNFDDGKIDEKVIELKNAIDIFLKKTDENTIKKNNQDNIQGINDVILNEDKEKLQTYLVKKNPVLVLNILNTNVRGLFNKLEILNKNYFNVKDDETYKTYFNRIKQYLDNSIKNFNNSCNPLIKAGLLSKNMSAKDDCHAVNGAFLRFIKDFDNINNLYRGFLFDKNLPKEEPILPNELTLTFKKNDNTFKLATIIINNKTFTIEPKEEFYNNEKINETINSVKNIPDFIKTFNIFKSYNPPNPKGILLNEKDIQNIIKRRIDVIDGGKKTIKHKKRNKNITRKYK
jgi:hypothetical protein